MAYDGHLMGALEDRRHGTRYDLLSQIIIGRGPRCDLQVQDSLVSTAHAELLWSGADWCLRDLGSRNGTYIDQEPVLDREPRRVVCGTILAFGRPENAFELIDDSPPAAVAIRADGLRRRALSGTLTLPGTDHALCMVIQERAGWQMEWSDGARNQVRSGDTIALGGHSWRLELPLMLNRTHLARIYMAALRLRFAVSKDERHARLEVHDGRRWHDMNTRAHWYTLVTLARERIADVATGKPDAGAGWMDVDHLVSGLELSNETFDQHVFRAKRDLRVRIQVADHNCLIERRPREVRIGIGAVHLKVSIV